LSGREWAAIQKWYKAVIYGVQELMMRAMVLGGFLVLATLLAGCESMSESQCRVADWGRVGFADGAGGVPESLLANYAEDCGKIGVHPNALAYRQGWDAGIVRFCTAANGWAQGVAGNSAKDAVCVGQAGYSLFSHNLLAGLQVYRTNAHIQSNDAEVKRLQKRLEKADDDKERKALRNTLSEIDHEQFRLRMLLGQQQLLAP
jgi:hypothetical protein